MPRIKVPLTRSTLMETQRSLTFAREGRDLLDRKREVLLVELRGITPEAEQAKEELVEGFRMAYQKLSAAKISMGSDRVRWAALAAPPRPDVEIVLRSTLGAVVPTIRCPPVEMGPLYSLSGVRVEMDQAAILFRRLLKTICAAARAEATVLRIAREIGKTQRRVNALDNVVIPTQEAIIKVVEEALEDAEREDFFRAKRMLSQRRISTRLE